jgi:signal transduction histidine kinase
MVPVPDRRRGPGRRETDQAVDAYDRVTVRGLLHDLGHEMTALSYLVEAVRGENGLPEEARFRLEILAQEMSRLLDIIAGELQGAPSTLEGSTVDLRSLACQVMQLVQVRHRTSVVLLPGPDVTVATNPAPLWRVLTNVFENAARAAGPGGSVTIRVREDRGAVIDVTDDGPGFGRGPSGTASLGLSVVASLLDSCGGSLKVRSPRAGGTRVSIRLPSAPRSEGRKSAGGSA